MLVVGGRVADAMSLKPKKGDFRSNVHLQSRTEPLRPTEEMARVAIEATDALGLEISGVDMIEEEDGALRVVDVNFSPGFKGLEYCTGKDMALEILGYIVRSASLPS
jgi:ribosomal protein S6--L-glutamate ligase